MELSLWGHLEVTRWKLCKLYSVRDYCHRDKLAALPDLNKTWSSLRHMVSWISLRSQAHFWLSIPAVILCSVDLRSGAWDEVNCKNKPLLWSFWSRAWEQGIASHQYCSQQNDQQWQICPSALSDMHTELSLSPCTSGWCRARSCNWCALGLSYLGHYNLGSNIHF